MPAIASWNAAMPPAAPEPTTITSHLPDFGVIEVESLRDSLVIAERSSVSVGSFVPPVVVPVRPDCIVKTPDLALVALQKPAPAPLLVFGMAFCPQCGQSLPSSVWQPWNSGRN